MDILQNQAYEMDNLVSLAGRFTVKEFQQALMNMGNSFKDYSAFNGEYVITTTKSLEVIGGEQIMDVEILLPISYRMPVDEPYLVKSKIKLTNSLYAKVSDITQLQESLNQVNQYILTNQLQPITSAYLVQTKQDNKPCIEIYIGINPNMI
jgi:hypothetical protein